MKINKPNDLIGKAVIVTLLGNLKVSGQIDDIYKTFLVLKIPITVEYHNGVREPTDIEKVIANISKAQNQGGVCSSFSICTGGEYKKEFSTHLIPIDKILKYEIENEK